MSDRQVGRTQFSKAVCLSVIRRMLLPDGESAVDDEVVAGHIIRGSGGQKERGALDVDAVASHSPQWRSVTVICNKGVAQIAVESTG